MGDNFTAPGVGLAFATDNVDEVHVPLNKIAFGGSGVATPVTEDTPFPVADPAIVSAVEALLAAINAAAAGTQPVSATSLPLPVGAATATGVAAVVTAIQTAMAATQPVSATTLPLPVGASTATKQDEIKAEVASLSTAKRWFAITPANSNLEVVPDCVYVGGPGDTLIARGDDGVDVTFPVTQYQVLPIRPTQIRTGGTATGLIGLVN